MSLYAFGKITGNDLASIARTLVAAADDESIAVALDEVDDDDRVTLSSTLGLEGPGVTFALRSTREDTDATRLWIQAMSSLHDAFGTSPPGEDAQCLKVVTTAFLQTRLGRLVKRIFELGHGAGLALVDGGIEDVFSGSAEQCLTRMALDVFLPWDQAANRLYMCARESQ